METIKANELLRAVLIEAISILMSSRMRVNTGGIGDATSVGKFRASVSILVSIGLFVNVNEREELSLDLVRENPELLELLKSIKCPIPVRNSW